jgi:DNA-binding CsgD family transcriptional regulator
MSDTDLALELVGNIYDAALDPALWPEVLKEAGAFVRGPSASLFAQDSVRHTGNVFYQWGSDPQFHDAYFERYIKLNPLTPMALFLDVETVHAGSDLMPFAEMQQTVFYKEWVRPQGWGDIIFANLEKTATSYAVFSVTRAERDGVVDEGMRRRMEQLVPHVRRAVVIGKVIDLKTVEAAAMADTLDGLAAGMFLVDARGRIAHANASGEAMLASGEIVRTAGGRLTAADAAANLALQDVAAAAAAGAGDRPVGVKGIAVPLAAAGGERYVAHVLPLTAGARRRAGTSYAAVAAVFVQKAGLDLPSPVETVAKLYRLTPGELRVMLAIVERDSIQDAAETLGISQATVKTHLRRVYEKTGAAGQVDLVKLVAGYAKSPTA